MVTKMGFTTEEALGGWVDSMRAIDRIYAKAYTPDQLVTWRAQNAGLDADSCASLLAAGFTKDGAPVSLIPALAPEWATLRAEAATVTAAAPF